MKLSMTAVPSGKFESMSKRYDCPTPDLEQSDAFLDSLIEESVEQPVDVPSVIVPTAEGRRYGPAGVDFSSKSVRERSRVLLKDSLEDIESGENLSAGELAFLDSVRELDSVQEV